jgi:hypothetical protein
VDIEVADLDVLGEEAIQYAQRLAPVTVASSLGQVAGKESPRCAMTAQAA